MTDPAAIRAAAARSTALAIYVASPLAHPDPATVRGRQHEAQCYLRRCYTTIPATSAVFFSPVAGTAGIYFAGDMPGDDYWRAQERILLPRFDALWVLMLPGWEDSVGIAHEIAVADRIELPVVHVAPDGDLVRALADTHERSIL